MNDVKSRLEVCMEKSKSIFKATNVTVNASGVYLEFNCKKAYQEAVLTLRSAGKKLSEYGFDEDLKSYGLHVR